MRRLLAAIASILPTALPIALALSLPGCCCGGASGPPSPGPVGHVAGRVLFTNRYPLGPATVYALDEGHPYHDTAGYRTTRVIPPATNYSIDLPPGYYYLLARLDSDLSSAAGHTYATGLLPVRVDSGTTAMGVDVGDWQKLDNRQALWEIDTEGAILRSEPWVTPSPDIASLSAVPSREMPPGNAPYDGSILMAPGLRMVLPREWHRLDQPRPSTWRSYAANEPVEAPLMLDTNGIFLDVSSLGDRTCPTPDLSVTTGRASANIRDVAVTIYFQDRPAGDQLQPFLGYSVMTDELIFDNCIRIVFTARSKSARDANLALIVGILEHASFYKA